MEKLELAVEPAPSSAHVAYARCASHDQKDDLERQAHWLMASIGASNKRLIKDLGSGINFKKKGRKFMELEKGETIQGRSITQRLKSSEVGTFKHIDQFDRQHPKKIGKSRIKDLYTITRWNL